jgi:stage III sporulation protein AG
MGLNSNEQQTKKSGWLQWLTTMFSKDQKNSSKKMWKWLIVLLLIGLALMMISSFVETKEVPNEFRTTARGSPESLNQPLSNDEMSTVEASYERELQEILTQVIGIGKVDVYVNLDSMGEVVVEKNKQDSQQVTNEQDAKGAVRQVTEVTRDGEVAYTGEGSNKQPLISKRLKPQVRGVLVVATGVERTTLKNMVIEAVERTLAVPRHRISVLPRKYKE